MHSQTDSWLGPDSLTNKTRTVDLAPYGYMVVNPELQSQKDPSISNISNSCTKTVHFEFDQVFN